MMRPRVLYLVTVLIMFLILARGQHPAHNGSRYKFYRSMKVSDEDGDGTLDTRRIFGGVATELTDFPTVCALLDRMWNTHCSATVVTPYWALTAGHCVGPRIAYVKYNTRRPTSSEGNITPVLSRYRHPEYKVRHEDEGSGVTVTLLHHDVGLVQTRDYMRLSTPLRSDPIKAMRMYDFVDFNRKVVQVFGFGRTEQLSRGEALFSTRLRLIFCMHNSWFYCVCGIDPEYNSRGVCIGDSGGPLVYNGVQVGVTSMGPAECETPSINMATDAISVFTTLYNYVDILNNTIYDTNNALRMSTVSRAVHFKCTYILLHLTVTLVLWHLR